MDQKLVILITLERELSDTEENALPWDNIHTLGDEAVRKAFINFRSAKRGRKQIRAGEVLDLAIHKACQKFAPIIAERLPATVYVVFDQMDPGSITHPLALFSDARPLCLPWDELHTLDQST